MSPQITPATTALLSMDFQNGIIGMVPDNEALVARQVATITAARNAGVTIAHVRVGFADDDHLAGQMAKRIGENRATFHADAPATQHPAPLAPQDGDIAVRKTRVGPFSTTDLHEQLQARGITTLILTGISTTGVVLSATRDAHDRDYDLIVVSDLTADRDPQVHAFVTEHVLAHQADVMTSTELMEALA